MTDRDTKPQSKETGFRELFVETRPARSRFADIMTPQDFDRRCADLPSRGNARMHALEGLVIALKRSQDAAVSLALDLARRRDGALNVIVSYQRCDDIDARVQAWVIDQVARILSGDEYDKLVAHASAGANGPATYSWDVGIAP